jgi:hypothetical protein
MTVSIVTRWSSPDAQKSTELAKKAKAIWIKNGALDVRLNQVHTGPFTGQYIFVTVFPDMATYAKALAATSSSGDIQKIVAANTKLGAVLLERGILIGVDL